MRKSNAETVGGDTLTRTDARKEATMEKVMATSYIELAIEVLTGKLKRCMED